MHASLGPSAASAVWRDGGLMIDSASQGIEPLRLVIARVLDMDARRVEIRHVAGAGCYGHTVPMTRPSTRRSWREPSRASGSC